MRRPCKRLQRFHGQHRSRRADGRRRPGARTEHRDPQANKGLGRRPQYAASAASAARRQEGKNAAQLRENLKRVKLPPGFKIDLYAVVPDARHMAMAPNTNMLFVGTRKNTVWAVTNRNSGNVATDVKPFAPSAKFRSARPATSGRRCRARAR